MAAVEWKKLRAILPQGTVVHRIQDNQWLTLEKDTYVNVLKYGHLHVRKKSVYVLSKKNKILYTAPFDQVIFIDKVSNLLQRPTSYQEYPPPKEEKSDSIKFFQELSLELSLCTPEFLKNIGRHNKRHFSNMGPLYQVHLDFDRTFVLGGKINYTMGKMDSTDGGQFKIQRLTLGPTASIPIGEVNGRKAFFQMGPLFSPLFKVKDPLSHRNFYFTSRSLQVGLKIYYPNRPADFMFGIHLSREYISPRINKFPEVPTVQNTKEEALSLLLGASW